MCKEKDSLVSLTFMRTDTTVHAIVTSIPFVTKGTVDCCSLVLVVEFGEVLQASEEDVERFFLIAEEKFGPLNYRSLEEVKMYIHCAMYCEEDPAYSFSEEFVLN